jgi:lysophospholipase L1-like esterase
MQQLLVYADSLTWGIIPDTRRRLAFNERWPGVLEAELEDSGLDVRIIEDCLNGRRTCFDDPYKPGRNGLEGLEQRIECHSPLALVLLMLGTNDFQSMHDHNAWHSAQGTQALIHAIRRAPIEPGMPCPEIMVIAPPELQTPKGPIAPKFAGGEVGCRGLGAALAEVAATNECAFFDAGTVTKTSEIDGVHLDKAQHATLGRALRDPVAALIGRAPQP